MTAMNQKRTSERQPPSPSPQQGGTISSSSTRKTSSSIIALCAIILLTHHVVSAFVLPPPRPIAAIRSNSITSCCASSNVSQENDDDVDGMRKGNNKRIVLIRHGCTYMNEYLSEPGSKWGDPSFTDIFPQQQQQEEDLYKDSKLSPLGIWQAGKLRSELRDNPIVQEIDSVLCSPLTRALKTMHIGLYPYLDLDRVPIVALPEASERVYLISDIGRPSRLLKEEFPYVDFGLCSSGGGGEEEEWWYTVDDNDSSSSTEYVEWRPSNANQRYACKGESQIDFDNRMQKLYDHLSSRTERTIALICHWGVIDWLIGQDFDNCEMRVVDFDSEMKRGGFMIGDDEAAELFSEGERSVVHLEDGGE